MPNWLGWIFSDFFTHLGFVLALVFLANLFRQRRSPSSTVAWLLVILMFPWVGVPLYLMLGGRKMGRLARRKEEIYHRPPGPSDNDHGSAVGRLLASYGIPPARAGNRVELVTSGEVAFERVLRLIDEARSTIYITTYILGRDQGSKVLIEHLTRRAAEGISVRLLLDDVGSWRVGRRFLAPLKAAGVEVAFFMPVLHMPFRGRANLRNHRKVMVVDGRIALTGGMNLAWPYMGPPISPRSVARRLGGRRGTRGLGPRGSVRVGLEVHHGCRTGQPPPRTFLTLPRGAWSRLSFKSSPVVPTLPVIPSTNHSWP